MDKNIEKTLDFLKEQFTRSRYMKNNPIAKKYRLEHTLRVANIGKEIACKEGLNEEALIIGCLLHDISYINDFTTEEDRVNHGRKAAEIARPFLRTIDLNKEIVDEICYGIAIHVDDQSDLAGVRTPLAVSIGDCDNIDRFDVYRIYENLLHKSFAELPYREQVEYVDGVLEKLKKYISMEFGTRTATDMWVDKISFQLDYYTRLKSQLHSSLSSGLTGDKGDKFLSLEK